MIYKLHYFLVFAGANTFLILIGVFIETYTDASPSELGALLMVTPFLGVFARPLICSMADRKQAHRKYLIICFIWKIISYLPFIVIPFMGAQLYQQYARACWYLLAALKVGGDLAWGGLNSIADSLAINYAKRVGDDFGAYRVYGTISWMLNGIIIGQVNEVWFLPKYVPAFLILVGSLALDAFLIWLWPAEYFIMSEDKAGSEQEQRPENNQLSQAHANRVAVWPQAKRKLAGIFCCNLTGETGGARIEAEAEAEVKSGVRAATSVEEKKSKEIGRMTQLKILAILMRRDQRVILYLAYFVLSGGYHASLSFFFISLSKICQQDNSCDFSQLTGFLQFSMAGLETVLFIYIKRITDKLGRLNLASFALIASSAKFIFYGTVWTQVSPYYSLLAEGLTGVVFGINLSLMVEVGHLFSNEVKYLIPELLSRNVISPDTDMNKLKYSLAATMQSLVSSAFEGVGVGLGSLMFGILLERITFEALWLIIGVACSVCLIVLVSVNMIDAIFNLKLGLDVRANDELKVSTIEVLQLDSLHSNQRPVQQQV